MKTTTIKADDGREVRVELGEYDAWISFALGAPKHLPAWVVRAVMGHGAEQAAGPHGPKSAQVAPLLATLRSLIPDATEVIAELGKLAAHVDETEARAEQAERRAEQMVEEMARRWAGASHEAEQAERERDEARHALRGVAKVLRAPDGFAHAHLPELAADTIEQFNRLAGDGKEVAIILALTEECDALRARAAKLEAVVGAARKCAQNPVAVHDALRALDDSGGSGRIPGSATREAAHASSSGPEPGPEPAGSSTNSPSLVQPDESRRPHVVTTALGGRITVDDAGRVSEWRQPDGLLDSPVGAVATAEGPGPGPLCAKCGAPIGYCRTVCARDVEDAERVRDAARSVSNGQAPKPPKPPARSGVRGPSLSRCTSQTGHIGSVCPGGGSTGGKPLSTTAITAERRRRSCPTPNPRPTTSPAPTWRR